MAFLEAVPLLEEEGALIGRAIARRGALRGGARYAGQLAVRGGRALARVARRNPFAAGMAGAYLGKALMKRKAGPTKRVSRPMKKPKTDPPSRTYPPTKGYHMADYSKKFRKGMKPNLSTKFIKRHYDDYGSLERNHSLWIGFQTHGCRERIMQMASEAMLRALLSRVDYYPSTYEQVFPDNGVLQALKIRWTFTNIEDGALIGTDRTYNLGGATFEAVANSIRSDWMNTGTTVTQGVPTRAVFYRNDNTSASAQTLRVIREIEDLDKMKLKLYAKQSVRIQNLTPNDAGSTNLDVTGTNPVQGKIYEFTTPPRLREQVAESYPDARALQDHLDDDGVRWLDNSAITYIDGILGHPPPAGGLFTNCRKVANVAIGAGQMKHKNTLFTFKGTVLEFSQKFRVIQGLLAEGQPYKKHGGGIVWFGFEQKFRAGPDVVKLGFNREVSMIGRAEFARARPMLRHYEQTDIGDITNNEYPPP